MDVQVGQMRKKGSVAPYLNDIKAIKRRKIMVEALLFCLAWWGFE